MDARINTIQIMVLMTRVILKCRRIITVKAILPRSKSSYNMHFLHIVAGESFLLTVKNNVVLFGFLR